MNEAIGVVTVTYGPAAALAAFLDSLPAATTAAVDVVIVDNADDGVPAAAVQAAAEQPGVRLVTAGANFGYGRAANLGVGATTSEFVVVANPDVVWAPGALDELLAATARWPRAGSLGPLIRTPTGEVYPSARDLPTLGRGIGHALCGWWWPTNPWTTAYRRERGAPVERAAGWLSGSCLLVRRSAFDAVHGFDPEFFMYFEDTDLGDRLGRAGWQNVYVPSAEIVHTGGHATAQDSERMIGEHHRSAVRYLDRRYPGRRWWPVRFVLRLGLAARARLATRFPAVAAGAPARRS